MTVTFRPAKRENVPLLLGLAGGTGSGKTYSAMRLAKGLAGDKQFAVIDTENGRASHYASEFVFDHAQLHAPFRPDAYAAAIEEAAKQGYGVIVVDSMTHEWDGDGGMLDWQEEEYQRLGGRDAVKMTSWIKPKTAHRKMVTRLLQVPVHIVLCFRAAEKVDLVKDDHGKTKVVPKRSPTGLDGWMPITEKNLPYELTLSCLLTADAPGVPKPIKLQEQHRVLVPLDQTLSEDTGRALAKWAAGDAVKPSAADKRIAKVVREIMDCADRLGNRDVVTAAIAKNRRAHAGNPGAHAEWLQATLEAAQAKLAEAEQAADADPFAGLPAEGAAV